MRENKQVQICGLRLKGPHALVIPSKDPMRRAMIVELFCGFFCEKQIYGKNIHSFFQSHDTHSFFAMRFLSLNFLF
jgi:hypothetical protein